MRFQEGPLADADFYEYVDSETLEMVRVHHDNIVFRAELEEGPSGFDVANFLDEAISCGIRVSPLVIQPSGLDSVRRLLCVVNHCFSVLPAVAFFKGFASW